MAISDRSVWPTMWTETILGGRITEMLLVGKTTSNIVVTRTGLSTERSINVK